MMEERRRGQSPVAMIVMQLASDPLKRTVVK